MVGLLNTFTGLYAVLLNVGGCYHHFHSMLTPNMPYLRFRAGLPTQNLLKLKFEVLLNFVIYINTKIKTGAELIE
jgi:hypothetical protein